MSPVRPSELGAKKPLTSIILADQACTGCGYNLKGLASGAKCPECGRTILAKDIRLGENLTDAPRAYLRLQTFAALLLMLAFAPNLLSGLVAPALAGAHARGKADPGVLLVFFAIAVWPMLLWLVGVLLVVRRREGASNADAHPRLRAAVVLSQSAWLATAALMFLSSLLGASPSIDAVADASFVASLVGYFGLGLLALHLSRVCEWASDTALAGYFRTITWIVYALGGLVLLGNLFLWLHTTTRAALLAPFTGMLAMGVMVAWLGVVIGVFVELVLHVNYWRMLRWAVRISIAREERDDRVARRAERAARQGEAQRALEARRKASPSSPASPSGAGPLDLLPPDASTGEGPAKPQGKVVDRPEGGAGEYDLDR